MRRTYKWLITVGTSIAAFGFSWWILAGLMGVETGIALGIAAVPGGLTSTLFGWWAGREASGPHVISPATRHDEHRTRRGQLAMLPYAVPIIKPAIGQIVVGPVPREPQQFQAPVHVLQALVDIAGSNSLAVVCSLTGQRGVGKTQAAGAYARMRIADGWLVAWIPAQTNELVEAGLLELADSLGLGNIDDTTTAITSRLRNYLQTLREPALLVFDNVADPSHITPHLPAAGSAQVVLTSASRVFDRIGKPILVDRFSPETAIRFLIDTTRIADAAGARAVAEELGYLPLALAQAAARIARNDGDFGKYLRNHRTLPVAQMLKARPGDFYSHGTAEAILLAIAPFAKSKSTREMQLLNLLSVLSSDGISRTLLETIVGDLPGDTVDTLIDASLVEFAGANNAVIVMHRLTQRVIRDRVSHSVPATLDYATQSIRRCLRRKDALGEESELGDELVRQIETLWSHFRQTSKVSRYHVLRLPAWVRNWLERATLVGKALALRDWADRQQIVSIERQIVESAGPVVSIHLWNQVVNLQPNGDVHERITIEATVLRENLYFIRLTAGSRWDQPERHRRNVRISADMLMTGDSEYTSCDLTTAWISTQKMTTVIHFRQAAQRREKISLRIDRVWPGKCRPLMRENNSEAFVFRGTNLLAVRRIEYAIVLPAGYDAFHEPVVPSEIEANLSVQRKRDDEGRLVTEWSADEVPAACTVGVRLELAK